MKNQRKNEQILLHVEELEERIAPDITTLNPAGNSTN